MNELQLARALKERLSLSQEASWMLGRKTNDSGSLELAILVYGLKDKVIDAKALFGDKVLINPLHIIDMGVLRSDTEKVFVLLYLEFQILINKKSDLIETYHNIINTPIKIGTFPVPFHAPTPPLPTHP